MYKNNPFRLVNKNKNMSFNVDLKKRGFFKYRISLFDDKHKHRILQYKDHQCTDCPNKTHYYQLFYFICYHQ